MNYATPKRGGQGVPLEQNFGGQPSAFQSIKLLTESVNYVIGGRGGGQKWLILASHNLWMAPDSGDLGQKSLNEHASDTFLNSPVDEADLQTLPDLPPGSGFRQEMRKTLAKN